MARRADRQKIAVSALVGTWDAAVAGMFKKILCPIDFSIDSKTALQVAVRMAVDADAELELVHVWNLPVMPSSRFPLPVDAVELVMNEQERELASAARDASRLGAKNVTTKLINGAAWDRIVHAAADAVDLVVIGTRGRTGIARVLLGSVAEKVVRHAACSVLVARPRGDAKAFERVLCPVDFSDSSKQAVELAAQLAAPRGAGITLFHAIEIPAIYYDEALPPDFLGDVEKQTTHLIEQWAADLRTKTSVPVTTELQTGGAGARILDRLDGATYDLVVVGSHGRTGLQRVLLGSTAEKVVRHAPCSVLVARARTTPGPR